MNPYRHAATLLRETSLSFREISSITGLDICQARVVGLKLKAARGPLTPAADADDRFRPAGTAPCRLSKQRHSPKARCPDRWVAFERNAGQLLGAFEYQ